MRGVLRMIPGLGGIGLSHFPYAIFYRLVDDLLPITAVAHHRKKPGYWFSRLGL